MGTLYWHDYETWGEVPSQDKPSQFAGIRTDEDLNIIGQPLMLYCRPSRDILPKPEACLITGVTPQQAAAEGVSEPQFMAAVHAELSQPGTCGVGYNTLRFDDEVTRYGLYRNFYDPYEREWKNGNSRWDIIDVVRLTYALRPEGINWPRHDDGKPSFKLEHLTEANGIGHEAAHDALSDVYATIAMAKLIRQHQPKLYDYAYKLRSKREVQSMLDIVGGKPLLHISSMFPAERGCAALVMPLCQHPTNSNGVVVYDLSVDPRPLLELSVEEVSERLFTRREDLPEGVERIPLKVVHINKCPMLVTTKMLDEPTAERLQINLDQCRRHWQQLRRGDLGGKLSQLYSQQQFADKTDAEQMLYSGFIKPQDKPLMQQVREASPEALANTPLQFQDARLNELLFRYRARHYPQTLSDEEQGRWEDFCFRRLTDPEAGASITLEEYFERLAALRSDETLSDRQRQILDQLEAYGDSVLG